MSPLTFNSPSYAPGLALNAASTTHLMESGTGAPCSDFASVILSSSHSSIVVSILSTVLSSNTGSGAVDSLVEELSLFISERLGTATGDNIWVSLVNNGPLFIEGLRQVWRKITQKNK